MSCRYNIRNQSFLKTRTRFIVGCTLIILNFLVFRVKYLYLFFSRDEEMDGIWEAPLIENPACESAPGCGKWTPPMMPNPEFKGK